MSFGPSDLIVLQFKNNRFSDEIIASLADLVASETIRILDLVIVRKDARGKVLIQELRELSPHDLQLIESLRAEVSELITVNDIQAVGKKLNENTLAAIMLFENLWAIRLKQDVSDGGGRLVMHERIPSEIVSEAIKDLAEYD